MYTKQKNDKLDGGRGHGQPQFRQAGRPGGSLTIHEAKPRSDSKGKAKAGSSKVEKIWDVPKSKEVKRLEELKDRLTLVQEGGKVTRDETIVDCFCLGRVLHAPAVILLTLQHAYTLYQNTPHNVQDVVLFFVPSINPSFLVQAVINLSIHPPNSLDSYFVSRMT